MSDFKYWAFISYSHKDEEWARWLHQALETYNVPRYLTKSSHGQDLPKRLFPVFRDRNELSSSPQLGSAIQVAIQSSRYLIVICSPSSASSRWVAQEIEMFKSLGREEQVLCLIVDGEPYASRYGNEKRECFPAPIRFSTNAEGQQVDGGEPLAADARKHKDTKRDALLKIIAGILGVGFDALKQRERQRQRQHKLRLSLGATVLTLGFYVLLADANVPLLGSTRLRTLLDHYDISLLRRPLSQATIASVAESRRTVIYKKLKQQQQSNGWMNFSFEPRTMRKVGPQFHDTWTHPQALWALLRSPQVSSSDLKQLLKGIDVQFSQGKPVLYRGQKYGWSSDTDAATPQAQPTIWTAAAISAALSHRQEITPQQRQKLNAYMTYVQETLLFFWDAKSGAWNQYPNQVDKSQHNIGCGTLALLALLEMREHQVAWQGSQEKLDHMIRLTAQWLINQYAPSYSPPGWPGESDSDNPTIDGLTLQLYAELLRASAELGIQLPAKMLKQIPAYLNSCAQRSISFPVEKDEYRTLINDIDGGKPRIDKETIGFLWYPWAIDTAVLWLKQEGEQAAPEERVRVRRALGDFVTLRGAVEKYTSGYTFAASEALYGLSLQTQSRLLNSQQAK